MKRPEKGLQTVRQGRSELVNTLRTALLIPSFNEEPNIEKALTDSKTELAEAAFHV